MVRFPARRFVWSSAGDLPEVGPILGSDQPPVHFQLLSRLLDEHGPDAQAELYGGWLELANDQYRISEQPGDGFVEGVSALSSKGRTSMLRALRRWADQEGVLFDPRLPA